MTKLRFSGSFEEAALEAIRTLSAAEIAEVTGLSAKTIRDYSDGDRPGRASLAVAVRLDAACFAKSRRAPFLEAYTRQLSRLTSDPPRRHDDVVAEALDVPGAVGKLLDTVRHSTLASSPKGATLSDNEKARILTTLKEPRRELDQLEEAVIGNAD